MSDKSIISQIFETEVPKELYHYTSSTGLMGIIESQKIWTTKIHYLNDGSELQLGFQYIREEIESQKGNDIRSENELDEMIDALDSIKTINMSIASFTAEGDLLSQWRGYCKIGDGYSLCFDGEKLSEKAKSNFLCYLVPCKYEDTEHRLMVKELVSSAPVSGIPRNPNPNNPPLQKLGFSRAALLIAPMIKAKGFKEEKEWRLICGPFEYKRAQFRSGNFSLIPYWEFDLDLENTLKSITIGPTPEQDLSVEAVQGFLMKNFSARYSNEIPKIKKSEIPWRSI